MKSGNVSLLNLPMEMLGDPQNHLLLFHATSSISFNQWMALFMEELYALQRGDWGYRGGLVSMLADSKEAMDYTLSLGPTATMFCRSCKASKPGDLDVDVKELKRYKVSGPLPWRRPNISPDPVAQAETNQQRELIAMKAATESEFGIRGGAHALLDSELEGDPHRYVGFDFFHAVEDGSGQIPRLLIWLDTEALNQKVKRLTHQEPEVAHIRQGKELLSAIWKNYVWPNGMNQKQIPLPLTPSKDNLTGHQRGQIMQVLAHVFVFLKSNHYLQQKLVLPFPTTLFQELTDASKQITDVIWRRGTTDQLYTMILLLAKFGKVVVSRTLFCVDEVTFLCRWIPR